MGEEDLHRYEQLKQSFEKVGEYQDLVLLHPEEVGKREYTLEELLGVRRRPFASRWFVTGLNIGWNTIWLRSHFTDHHVKMAPTRRIRDFAKATITTQMEVTSRSTLCDILTLWFKMERSAYYSNACMIASAMSKFGQGITFERKENEDDSNYIVKEPEREYEELARLRFARLMYILFGKIRIERSLVKEGETNIFRLAYCLTKHEKSSNSINHLEVLLKSYGAGLAAFAIQVALTFYVCLACFQKANLRDMPESNTTNVTLSIDGNFSLAELVEQTEEPKPSFWLADPDDNWDKRGLNPFMIPMAFVTLVLSIVLSLPGLRSAPDVFHFYSTGGGWKDKYFHPWAIMDYVSNLVLPIVLWVAGFIVIGLQTDYIEAVMNSAALLFILDIDDLLPDLVHLDPTSVVRNYLIAEALIALKDVHEYMVVESERPSLSEAQKKVDRMKTRFETMGIRSIQFADMFLTNTPESGTTSDVVFAPYAIQGCHNYPDVTNSNFVNSNCLFSRIEWQYTSGFAFTTEPRIGLLRVWKLGENEPYVVRGNVDTPDKDEEEPVVVTITDMRRSASINKSAMNNVPFVVSVDGLLAPEAINTLKQIARKLSDKWQHPYSAIFGYVKSRIGISVIRGAHLCLRGSRVHVTAMSNRRYLWDDEEGFYCLHQQHF
jgi:hypothetical protein